ncbi:MAG: hypothetical protein OIF48_12855 [Silicimonas sp.]|jgi:hypothetical protein|nr:hypothetical protein [Silicimonas sp.]
MTEDAKKSPAPRPPAPEEGTMFDDPAFTAPVEPDDAAMLRLLSARAKRRET